MRLKKTQTELKQEDLFRAHRQSIAAKARHKAKKAEKKKAIKAKRLPYETTEELKKLSYKGFLKSKYWNKVRGLILKRDCYKCVICQSKIRLEVHHDTYIHHFDELKHLYDLITLCNKCHTAHHYSQK